MKANPDIRRLFILAIAELCLLLVLFVTPSYGAMACCSDGPCLAFIGFDFAYCGKVWTTSWDVGYVYCWGYIDGEWIGDQQWCRLAPLKVA